MLNQEKLITDLKKVSEKINGPDEKATKLFRHVFLDTIKNTVQIKENGQVFISTGDIPAMWLRDSTFQILPYLKVAVQVPEVRELLAGVLKQQIENINVDPYANAFNDGATGKHFSADESNIPISDKVWERKFEIDSLCAPLYLAYQLYSSGYQKHLSEVYWHTVRKIMNVFKTEQNHPQSEYYFKRTNCPPSDTLSNSGRGHEVKPTGMVWSGFRPSDDACTYGYFIPGNMFIKSVLKKNLEMLPNKKDYSDLKNSMVTMIKEISVGIEKYGVITTSTGTQVYAYEVDGFGNQLFMDDANTPSLMALPFLDTALYGDELYLNTREWCLSENNPYYFSGKYVAGVGSPHTPENFVWPMSLAIEGLTSQNEVLIKGQIDKIVELSYASMQVHESININDLSDFTREWFSWANMTFCDLILHYIDVIKSGDDFDK